MVSSKKLWTYGCVSSALCIAVSVTVLLVFPSIYRSGIAKMTNLVEGSFLYPIWRDLPLPIYKRLYFFNITNAEEFLLNGTKMEVDEVGPYTYVGRWIKEGMQWHEEGTVSYREVKTFHFVREESVGDEEDRIYTLNGPYIIAADYLKGAGPSVRYGANTILSILGEELVIMKTIKELAFGGYKDSIMRFGRFFRPDTPFKNGKFSWLTGHNDTDDGLFEVSTGERDHSLLNTIEKWNGDSLLNFWKNDSCNKIRGTNAEFSPPLKAEQTEYTFFQPIFCRAVTFRGNTTVIHKDIETRRFENREDIFSRQNPDNHCFHISPELKSGVLDVSPCQFGAPVVLSFPHFYLADSSFLENITGLDPNKDIHGSHIDAEILTGVTVDLSIKFQMNVRLEPIEHLTIFENAPSGIYPIFWLDLSVALPSDLIDTINYQLFRPRRIVHGVVAFVLALSTIFFVWSFWKRRITFEDERRSLIPKKSYFLYANRDCNEFKPNISENNFHADNISIMRSSESYDTAGSDKEVSSDVEINRKKLFKKAPKCKRSSSSI